MQKCNNKIPTLVTIDGKLRNLQRRKFCLECSPFGKHNTSNFLTKNKSKNVSRHRKKLKYKLFCYKGGCCQECGYNKIILGAYAFHHRDPQNKQFGIANSLVKSFKSLIEEVDKCDLLCVRCHAEKHDKEYIP